MCKPHNGHDFEMAAAARPNATVEMQTVRCRDNNNNNNNMNGHKRGNALIYGRKINISKRCTRLNDLKVRVRRAARCMQRVSTKMQLLKQPTATACSMLHVASQRERERGGLLQASVSKCFIKYFMLPCATGVT